MKNQKKSLLEWVNTHKKELMLAGICVSTLIAIILFSKNRATIESYWFSLEQLLEKSKPTSKPITYSPIIESSASNVPTEIISDNIIPFAKAPHHVCEHIRTLPNGYKASMAKLEFAKNAGINLLPGQTIVNAYTTGGIAV
ncbi:hypothetical protein DW091_13385 [Eubacterium sp. AM05-23]|uniref:hypothetical protein n=1 Tax=Eubacterium TaxID=1730 RepID=UPI000E4C528E|nr:MULTISPECIES: hypothetical protein [Eubacterium]RHO56690.1 hypothetical protein DW091_13385 [Eubacterium sp. AM05-23]